MWNKSTDFDEIKFMKFRHIFWFLRKFSRKNCVRREQMLKAARKYLLFFAKIFAKTGLVKSRKCKYLILRKRTLNTKLRKLSHFRKNETRHFCFNPIIMIPVQFWIDLSDKIQIVNFQNSRVLLRNCKGLKDWLLCFYYSKRSPHIPLRREFCLLQSELKACKKLLQRSGVACYISPKLEVSQPGIEPGPPRWEAKIKAIGIAC